MFSMVSWFFAVFGLSVIIMSLLVSEACKINQDIGEDYSGVNVLKFRGMYEGGRSLEELCDYLLCTLA